MVVPGDIAVVLVVVAPAAVAAVAAAAYKQVGVWCIFVYVVDICFSFADPLRTPNGVHRSTVVRRKTAAQLSKESIKTCCRLLSVFSRGVQIRREWRCVATAQCSVFCIQLNKCVFCILAQLRIRQTLQCSHLTGPQSWESCAGVHGVKEKRRSGSFLSFLPVKRQLV